MVGSGVKLSPRSCLNKAGLSLSDTNLQIFKMKDKLIFPCLLSILLTTNLHPFIMGLLFGAAIILSVVGRWICKLINLKKDNIRRVKMVASADRRCPILWLVTLGLWSRKVPTRTINLKGNRFDVVNLWPLELGEFSEELFAKYGTKITCTAIVEVVGRSLVIMYTVNNMARKYVMEDQDEVRVFNFQHKIDLTTANIYLVGLAEKPVSKKYSRKLPICVESKNNGQVQSFYILHRIKRRKEVLFNRLINAQMINEKELDEENMVDKIINECRLKCSSGDEVRDDCGIQMVNVMINKLGWGFLTEEVIFQPLQNILRRKLKKKFGQFFKNLGLKNVELGDTYPLVKKLGKPWYNHRGMWAKVVICKNSCPHSITLENQCTDNCLFQSSNGNGDNYSISSGSSEDNSDQEQDFSPADWFSQEISHLSFTMDILQFELVFLLNVPPPPSPSVPQLRLWLGLCHPPNVDIQMTVGGTKSTLTSSVLNTFMPVLRAATLKRLKSHLVAKWVFPNMKEFRLHM